MATERLTITLPARLAADLKKRAKARKKPVSKLIAEALEAERERALRERLVEGYKANSEENRRLAEEWWPISAETWPRD